MTTDTDFTTEQLLNQARGNLSATMFLTVSFCKERGLSLDEYWLYLAHKFAPGWPQDATLKRVAEIFALNFASHGAEIRSLSGNESRTELVFGGWPEQGLLDFCGLTWEDVDPLFNAMGPFAAQTGCTFEWHRDGDEVTFVFSRQ